MSFCTKCGKSCNENAKFCTSCGNPFIKVIPLVPEQQDQPEYKAPANPGTPPPLAAKKNNKALWWGLGILVAAGLGTGAYFIFGNKNSSAQTNNDELLKSVSTTKVDSPRVQTLPQTNNNNPSQPINRTLAQGGGAITAKEAEDISAILKLFFEADNAENVSAILDYFVYPVRRYYNTNEVSYEKLKSMFENAFSSQLLHHTISVNWEGSVVNKTANGYTVKVYATYEFATQKKPEEERSRSFNVFIQMNNDKQITSVYEIP